MKRLPPDRRPKWRDPNLTCVRSYKFGDGTTKTDIDPNYERRYREHLMKVAKHPNWRDDPTYNLRKHRRNAH